MGDDAFQAFQNQIETDPRLQQQLTAAADAYVQAVVKIAKDAGFTIAPDAVKAAPFDSEAASPSEDDLSGMTGGNLPTWTTALTPPKDGYI